MQAQPCGSIRTGFSSAPQRLASAIVIAAPVFMSTNRTVTCARQRHHLPTCTPSRVERAVTVQARTDGEKRSPMVLRVTLGFPCSFGSLFVICMSRRRQRPAGSSALSTLHSPSLLSFVCVRGGAGGTIQVGVTPHGTSSTRMGIGAVPEDNQQGPAVSDWQVGLLPPHPRASRAVRTCTHSSCHRVAVWFLAGWWQSRMICSVSPFQFLTFANPLPSQVGVWSAGWTLQQSGEWDALPSFHCRR